MTDVKKVYSVTLLFLGCTNEYAFESARSEFGKERCWELRLNKLSKVSFKMMNVVEYIESNIHQSQSTKNR